MTNNFKTECKNAAYKNRLAKVIYDNDEEITNNDYLSEIEITDTCSSNDNVVGTTVSKQIKFKTLYPYELMDKTIETKVGVKYDDDTTEYIDLGKVIIDTEELDNINGNGSYTGNDLLSRLKYKYECGITNLSNATIGDFFSDICEQLNVETDTETFTNSTLVIGGNPFTNNETIEFVLQEIGKASCCWVEITANNKLNLNWFSNTITETFTKNDYASLTKNNIYGPVNTLVIGIKDAEGENVTEEDEESVALNGEIQLAIYDSYFLSTEALRTQAKTSIWNKVNGLTYTNFELTSYTGKPYIKRGDKIEIEEKDGTTFTSYALNHVFTYDGSFKSVISATSLSNGETTQKSTSESLSTKFKKTELLVNKIDGEISSTIEEVGEQNEKISQITQKVDGIEQKISEIADITTKKESNYAEVELEKVNQCEPINIKIYPTSQNISYLYPNPNLHPDDELYSKVRILRFTNLTTSEIIDYELPLDLLYYNATVYDEFELDYEQTKCQVIKKCKYNANGEVVVQATEIINIPYPEIMLNTGDYKVELIGYSNGYLNVRLMATNIYTTTFASKVEVNSSITQTSNEIMSEVSEKYFLKDDAEELKTQITQTSNEIKLEVSRAKDEEDRISGELSLKVNTDELVSELNASADVINITSNRFKLDSTNFKVTENGTITSTSGNIGGWNINSDGLSNGKFYVRSTGFSNTYSYADLVIIHNYILGKIYLDDNYLKHYDLNNDGKVNAYELAYFQRYFVNEDN